MRKVTFFLETGYVCEGMVSIEEFPDNTTDEELETYAWEAAVQHAESMGRELCPHEEEDGDCTNEYCEFEHRVSTDIEGSWIDYVAEEHDMLI